MGNKYKTLLKDTSIFALGSLGSKLIVFFLVPLYTNCLTTEQYGTADLIFTIAQLIVPFASLVIFDAVIRFGLYYKDNSQDVLLVGLSVCGIGAILAVALSFLLMFYKPVSNWILYIDLYVVSGMVLSVLLNYLKVKDRNMLYSITSIIQTVILAVSNIICLLYLKIGIKGYLLSYIISQVCAIFICVLFGKIIPELKKAKFDFGIAKEMIVYSAPLILNNISWWVIHSSDKVMIEAMIGASVLGLYTVAAKMPSFINVFVTIFQQAWGISSIKEFDLSKDKTFFKNVFETLFIFVSTACLVLILIIKPFMSIYASGAGYEEVWRLVPMLLVSAVFSATAAYYGSIYGALKKSINNMVTTIIAAVINIVANYIFIKVWGVYGAAVGTLIAYLTLSIARMIDVSRYFRIGVDVVKYVFNSGILVTVAILVTLGLNVYIVSSVAIVVFACVNYKTYYVIIMKIAEITKKVFKKNQNRCEENNNNDTK